MHQLINSAVLKPRLRSRLLQVFLIVLAAAPAVAEDTPRKPSHWYVMKDAHEGVPTCYLFGLADEHTFLAGTINPEMQSRGVAEISFMNMNWSIRTGGTVGTMALKTASQTMEGTPPAKDYGFSFYNEIDALQSWANSAAGSFWLEIDGKFVARYPAGNLAAALGELKTCGASLQTSDPFEKPRRR